MAPRRKVKLGELMRSVGRNLRIVLTEIWTEADVEEEDERAVREEREELEPKGGPESALPLVSPPGVGRQSGRRLR